MDESPSKTLIQPESDFRQAHRRRLAAWTEALAPRLGPSHPLLPDLACALDDHFAWEPFAENPSDIHPFAKTALDSLQSVNRAELERAVTSLPVIPAAAQRALALLSSQDWSASALKSIAESDPVLAAELIRVSNSSAFLARQEIKTLGHAVAYLGAERACHVLVASSIKRVFVTRKLNDLWNHSLEASQTARAIARRSRQAHPEQALLAGLVHDIGRLATALLPEDFQRRSALLLQQGCELSMVERVLCGVTHAELGARVLERWNFPKDLAGAVRFHHQPERSASPLASILYLTERSTAPLEDPPSLARAKTALDNLGLDLEDLYELDMAGGFF